MPQGPLKIVKPDALATVLFSDLRGYAQFTEGLSPLQLLKDLNTYMSVLNELLHENHGTVAKFIGDALFAYWLADEHPDHAKLACRFASLARTRVSPVFDRMTTHVGINTGRIALVSIDQGTYHSLEPMGDTVNLAARIEMLCAQYNVQAIATEQVIAHAENSPGWNSLGPVIVKGRTEPVTLYGLT